MNRGKLVETVAKLNKLTKKQADAVFQSVIETIQSAVKKEGSVRIVGFGTFKKAERKARNGRNPQTGDKIKIAKKVFPKFTASKTWELSGTRRAAKKSK